MSKITNISYRRPANQLAVAGFPCNDICVDTDEHFDICQFYI